METIPEITRQRIRSVTHTRLLQRKSQERNTVSFARQSFSATGPIPLPNKRRSSVNASNASVTIYRLQREPTSKKPLLSSQTVPDFSTYAAYRTTLSSRESRLVSQSLTAFRPSTTHNIVRKPVVHTVWKSNDDLAEQLRNEEKENVDNQQPITTASLHNTPRLQRNNTDITVPSKPVEVFPRLTLPKGSAEYEKLKDELLSQPEESVPTLPPRHPVCSPRNKGRPLPKLNPLRGYAKAALKRAQSERLDVNAVLSAWRKRDMSP